MRPVTSFGLLALCFFSSAALAQVPSKVAYQGRLLKSDGTPAGGTLKFKFDIYDDATAGNLLFGEEQTLGLTDGFYATHLGDGTASGIPSGVFTGAERYLEVTVAGEKLTPRQRVSSVPYAMMANDARNLSGGTVDATSIKVGGNTVIDSQGALVGSAAYAAGAGLTLSGSTFSVDSQGCNSGQALTWNGTGWACASGVSYQAGGGLVLAGNIFSIDSTGCAAAQVLAWNGTAWACAQDLNNSYTAGSGLSLSGGAFSLDSTGCSAGQVQKWNGTSWACAQDSDTTYSAGAGLALSAGAFSIDAQGCTAGQRLTWNGTAWACAPAASYQAGDGLALSGNTFSIGSAGCSAGQVLNWNGAAWACATDQDTTYTAGAGLSLYAGAFSLDSTGCSAGQVQKWNGASWACGPDIDTTYTAGAGLTLAGGAFSISSAGCAAEQVLRWTGTAWACGPSVTASSPLAGNGSAANPLSIPQAGSSASGYLSAGDWNSFNGKLGVVSAASPLTGSGTALAPLSIPPASSAAGGHLTAADWSTFNSKQNALKPATGATAPALCPVGEQLFGVDPSGNAVCSGSVVATSSPITGNGSGSSPISIPQAGSASSGYLTAADWSTFNNKLTTVVSNAPLAGTGTAGSPLSLPRSSGTADGYLASADWTTFNNKVSSVSAGTGATVGGTATNPTVGVLYGTTAGTAAQGNDPRLSDARAPLGGSNNYVQNLTASAQSASYRISGSGQIDGSLAVTSTTSYSNALTPAVLTIGGADTVDVAQGQGLMNVAAGAAINTAGSGYNYTQTGRGAARLYLGDGTFDLLLGATSGSAGSPVTWTTPLAVNNAGAVSFSGNVGIGTAPNAQRLAVGGIIQSTTGGVMFPDGTVQSAAIWTLAQQENYVNGASGWSDNTTSGCGQYGMLGGYNVRAGGCISKTFSGLSAHRSLRVRLKYHFIDSWDGEQGYLQVDGTTRWSLARTNCCSGPAPNLCGAGYPDGLGYDVEVELPHSAGSALIAVCSSLDQGATDESFGFSDFQLYVR
ncbi:MAG: hypothetical protein HYZ28_14995 [Myxococcales bacterium]|nr:hypothetical protein [Myxococcales bacterium]